LGFGVWGLGFGVWGLGLGLYLVSVYVSAERPGFGLGGSGSDLGFGVQGLALRVSGVCLEHLGLWGSGSQCDTLGFGG
jgi:hypothetical protein